MIRLFVAGLTATVVLTGSAFAAQPLTVSALTTLPAPTKTLPAALEQAIARQAPHAGVSGSVALSHTRLLDSNVTGLPLYAYGGNDGTVCFLVWRGGGTCGALKSPSAALWLVNGGNCTRGQAVVGIVPDQVTAVTVHLGARAVRVEPIHNVFVVPFRGKSCRVPIGQLGSVYPRITVSVED